jgi:hypothetical protein
MTYVKIYPRRCMKTGKGMESGWLAFGTDTYSRQDYLVARLREAAGNPKNIYDEPLTDEWLLSTEWPDDWMYTEFPFDDQDDYGNPIGYTADGQVVRLTVPTYHVRHPLEEMPPPHNA